MTINSKVETYLNDLRKSDFFKDEKVPESFQYMLSYYRKHSGRKRNKFRTASTILITSSSVLPFIAAFGDKIGIGNQVLNKDVVLAIISVTIALVSGVLTHFRWEVGWRGQSEALFALQNLKVEWDAAVARAMSSGDDDKAIKAIDEAFNSFRKNTYTVVHAEMGDFFKVTQSPNMKHNQ